MITRNDIKELRERYGLTQEELGRAIFVDRSTIQRYENNARGLSIETLEQILNVFGFTAKMTLIKKEKSNIDENFYKEKSSMEIVKLDDEDMIEYLYIKSSNDVIARLTGTDIGIIEMLTYEQVKKLLETELAKKTKREIYYILENTYNCNVSDALLIVDSINDFLNIKCFNGDSRDKIVYAEIVSDMTYSKESIGPVYKCLDVIFYDDAYNIVDLGIDDKSMLVNTFNKYLNGVGMNQNNIMNTKIKIKEPDFIRNLPILPEEYLEDVKDVGYLGNRTVIIDKNILAATNRTPADTIFKVHEGAGCYRFTSNNVIYIENIFTGASGGIDKCHVKQVVKKEYEDKIKDKIKSRDIII